MRPDSTTSTHNASLLYVALVRVRMEPGIAQRDEVRAALIAYVDAARNERLSVERVVVTVKAIAADAGWYVVGPSGWSHPDGDAGDLLRLDLVRLAIQQFHGDTDG